MKQILTAIVGSKIKQRKHHWQSYCDGQDTRSIMPEYLARNYWWAYLSPIGVNFFDHPFMVNPILWGQYHKIAEDTVNLLAEKSDYSLAEISCAYGEIIPRVGAESKANNIYLFDIAPIQLEQARKKIVHNNCHSKFTLFEANAENIPLQENSVDSSLLFFLLHELPVTVRKKVLQETLRITKPGGRVIVADYAPKTKNHWFHRMTFFRNIFETLEPFLGNFWRSNLVAELQYAAKLQGKSMELKGERFYWHKFYRLLEFTVEKES